MAGKRPDGPLALLAAQEGKGRAKWARTETTAHKVGSEGRERVGRPLGCAGSKRSRPWVLIRERENF